MSLLSGSPGRRPLHLCVGLCVFKDLLRCVFCLTSPLCWLAETVYQSGLVETLLLIIAHSSGREEESRGSSITRALFVFTLFELVPLHQVKAVASFIAQGVVHCSLGQKDLPRVLLIGEQLHRFTCLRSFVVWCPLGSLCLLVIDFLGCSSRQ